MRRTVRGQMRQFFRHPLEQANAERENDPLGEVVPREALDSTLAFVVEDTEGLIDRFLRGLDYSQGPTGNGFLMLPTEMAAEGFTGTPYRFDIAQDRHQRGV